MYLCNQNSQIIRLLWKVIPIEVKAEENLQAKSLKVFVERNPGLKGIRLSMSPYRDQDWLTNYPLLNFRK